MFGKKKEKDNGVMLQHYEGIVEFATDYPCKVEIKDSVLEIKRIKPETTVRLPLDRIKSFTVMEEPNFMLKYHGEAKSTAKFGKKFYLVVEYDKGMLAFWGTQLEYGKMLKFKDVLSAPTEVEL